MNQIELLESYYKVYKDQTTPKCPYHKPSMKNVLAGVDYNGILIYDAPNYRRIYSKEKPKIPDCSVLYVDHLSSFEDIPKHTIVVAKQLKAFSKDHIIVTSEETSFDTVELLYNIDELTYNHYLTHTKTFHVPELLDLHLIDAFIPLKHMDKFVSSLDNNMDFNEAISKYTEYSGISRMSIFDKEDFETYKPFKSSLDVYNMKSKLDLYTENRLKSYGCPIPLQKINSCPMHQ